MTAAWIEAGESIADPCFGRKIAEQWYPTDLHALGYAFLASRTLRTALTRLCRYTRVVDDAVGFVLEDGGERALLSLAADSSLLESGSPQEEDATLAFVVGLCRAGWGQSLKPAEVRIRHPPCDDPGPYSSFFGCRVRFETRETALAFRSADVDQPLPASNRELARLNDQVLHGFLVELRGDDVVSRVKKAIVDELPSGSPGDEAVAKAVSMSTRSLRRKLSAEGTSYSRLLDAVRQELAEQYIADPPRSLSEISYLLGFSDQSSFSRAFKRWTGQAPSAARKALSPSEGFAGPIG